ncbi:thermitase [Scopulibacillus daqui]|uniref:Thermitase n=1 Tax=Scopulibacillus daqui TaxID=1469162 RepID=A0ABS2Q1M5_9BACL|nr:S8 family peptidase [Scopulibacillus daqui]MBM7646041.1 thermitase [Scopulibacillus daqui]
MIKGFKALMMSLALFTCLALPVTGAEAHAKGPGYTPSSDQEIAPHELIVHFKPSVSAASSKNIVSQTGGKVIDQTDNFVVIKVKGKLSDAVKNLEKQSTVDYAEPNVIFHAMYIPNDPAYTIRQYAPQKINAEKAWDVTQSSPQVKIAIVDSGVDYNHPDLAGKVIKGHDFVDNDNDPMDENGHGTHVAGIAAANTNNGRGIAGIAPKASILAVRVLGADGDGTLSHVAQGIRYAADMGAQVINLSIGGNTGSKTLEDAVNYAWNKGSVVVAAAGNEGSSLPSYPAYYSHVIAVAATDQKDKLAPFSNHGSWVDIAAPGVDIYSTIPGGKYANLSGTSMASPVVAGVAGLLASQGENAPEIRSTLEKTADKVPGTGVLFQNGRIDAAKAVKQ